MTREALKARCRAAGMTQAEEGSIFHPWGGGIRELCERGFLCGTVSEEKAFRLCPAFTPMEEQDALLEQTRRYFTNYGPASIRDAAYYFGSSQAEIKKRLARLPVEAAECEGQRLFSLHSGRMPEQALPDCLLLAGFDPLVLGYEKKAEYISSAGVSARHFQSVRHRHAAGAAARQRSGPLEAQRKAPAYHAVPPIFAGGAWFCRGSRGAALGRSRTACLSGRIIDLFKPKNPCYTFSCPSYACMG